MARPAISCDAYRLVLAPECGGAVAEFSWGGLPVFRQMDGGGVLDAGCFPLVPFSNRIAHGKFMAGGRPVRLAPNFPGGDDPHPLHGFGWLSPWSLVESGPGYAALLHEYQPGDWPWPYQARQMFHLSPSGLVIALSVCNLGESPMPAGLGLHPYFPRTASTRYLGLHRGEWTTDAGGLPLSLDERDAPRDWWEERAVASRHVDTVQTGRQGPLLLEFPETGLRLAIEPSANLGCTAVFVPGDGDFFCIEPVTHATDAVNRPDGDSDKRHGMTWLEPGESLAAEVRFRVSPLEPDAPRK